MSESREGKYIKAAVYLCLITHLGSSQFLFYIIAQQILLLICWYNGLMWLRYTVLKYCTDVIIENITGITFLKGKCVFFFFSSEMWRNWSRPITLGLVLGDWGGCFWSLPVKAEALPSCSLVEAVEKKYYVHLLTEMQHKHVVVLYEILEKAKKKIHEWERWYVEGHKKAYMYVQFHPINREICDDNRWKQGGNTGFLSCLRGQTDTHIRQIRVRRVKTIYSLLLRQSRPSKELSILYSTNEGNINLMLHH